MIMVGLPPWVSIIGLIAMLVLAIYLWMQPPPPEPLKRKLVRCPCCRSLVYPEDINYGG